MKIFPTNRIPDTSTKKEDIGSCEKNVHLYNKDIDGLVDLKEYTIYFLQDDGEYKTFNKSPSMNINQESDGKELVKNRCSKCEENICTYKEQLFSIMNIK